MPRKKNEGADMAERLWRIAGAIFLVCMGMLALTAACVLFWAIWPDGWKGDGPAAWVQAIGSIGAIIGAVYVGRAQADESLRQAKLIRNLESQQRQEAIAAVVLAAYVRCMTIQTNAQQGTTAIALRNYWVQHGRVALDGALKALAAVPLFEMSSAKLIMDIQAVEGPLIKIRAELERLDSQWESLSGSDALRILNMVRAQCEVCHLSFLLFTQHDKELRSANR